MEAPRACGCAEGFLLGGWKQEWRAARHRIPLVSRFAFAFFCPFHALGACHGGKGVIGAPLDADYINTCVICTIIRVACALEWGEGLFFVSFCVFFVYFTLRVPAKAEKA